MAGNTLLYYNIVKDIKEKIQHGEYKEGDLLPTESEMCRIYNVSRVTVRKAIDGLIADGIIERPFSKTPRVKQSAVPRKINRMGGLSEDLARNGVLCSNFVLKTELVGAEEQIAKEMNIAPGTRLHLVERLRYANGQPLCYQKLYLNAELCPNLDINDLGKKSLYQLLETEHGLKVANCEQRINACMSSYRINAMLELQESTPMLKVCNRSYLQDGECFEYSENYYVGDNYQISVVLTR